MRKATIIGGALVLAALFGVVVAAAQHAETSGRATVAGSSFRADEAGHRAARLLLESVGLDVRSRRSARLPDGTGHVLVRIEGLPATADASIPDHELESEGAALAAWVEAGNAVLLLAAETPAGTGFPLVRERYAVPEPALVVGPAAPVATAEGLDAIFGSRPDVPTGGGDVRELHDFQELADPWITPYHAVSARGGDRVLVERDAGDGLQPVVVEARRGAGRVIVVADPWFATNARLGRADNAAWLVTLTERLAAGGAVWFDDRALGQAATRGVLSLFQEAGFGPALLAGFVLLFLVWWRVGPSDAPDRLVRPREQYRPEAYAELRAGLYADCLTPDEVRRMVHAEIARRLGRGDGVSFRRALSLLQTRDPERATRLEQAIASLPQHRDVSVTRHATTWSVAVTKVWNVLAEGTESSARSAKEQA